MRAKKRSRRLTPGLTLRLWSLLFLSLCLAFSDLSVKAEPLEEAPTLISLPDDLILPQEVILIEDTKAPLNPKSPQALHDQAACSAVLVPSSDPQQMKPLNEQLAEIAGATVNYTGTKHSLSTISLRGSNANQVQIYLDDLLLNSAQGGGVDLSLVPYNDLMRIEVYKGVTPLNFATNNLGGVISLTTRTPAENALKLYSGLGSFSTYYLGGALSYVAKKESESSLKISTSLHYLTAKNDFWYIDDQGTSLTTTAHTEKRRTNNARKQLDGLWKLSLPLKGRRVLEHSLFLLHRHEGIPGLALYPATYSNFTSERLLTKLAYTSQDDLGLNSKLTIFVYSNLERERFQDLYHETLPVAVDTDDLLQTLGAQVKFRKLLNPYLQLKALQESRYTNFKPTDRYQHALHGASASRLSEFLGLETKIRALPLEIWPSIKLEVTRDQLIQQANLLSNTETLPAKTFILTGTRLALKHQTLPTLSLKTNLGRYQRLPSLNERYGNLGYILPSPNLQPETSYNLDGGAHYENLKNAQLQIIVDTSVFFIFASDLIQFTNTSRHQLKAENIGKAQIYGLEEGLQLTYRRHWRFNLQGSWLDSRNLSNVAAYRDKQLPLKPRWSIYSKLSLETLPLNKHWQSGLYGDLSYQLGNYRDQANMLYIPHRLLLGAGGFIEHRPSHFKILVSGQNLTNTEVLDLIGFPLPGRSFFLSLVWQTTTSLQPALD